MIPLTLTALSLAYNSATICKICTLLIYLSKQAMTNVNIIPLLLLVVVAQKALLLHKVDTSNIQQLTENNNQHQCNFMYIIWCIKRHMHLRMVTMLIWWIYFIVHMMSILLFVKRFVCSVLFWY